MPMIHEKTKKPVRDVVNNYRGYKRYSNITSLLEDEGNAKSATRGSFWYDVFRLQELGGGHDKDINSIIVKVAKVFTKGATVEVGHAPGYLVIVAIPDAPGPGHKPSDTHIFKLDRPPRERDRGEYVRH